VTTVNEDLEDLANQPLMTDEEVELQYRGKITAPKLRLLRRQRKGPNYIKLNRLVRYRKNDIERWLENCKVITDDGGV